LSIGLRVELGNHAVELVDGAAQALPILLGKLRQLRSSKGAYQANGQRQPSNERAHDEMDLRWGPRLLFRVLGCKSHAAIWFRVPLPLRILKKVHFPQPALLVDDESQ
jgi:hypothetical protein